MPKSPAEVPEDKLDAILRHLQNLDRRDRLRTWGSFVRGLLSVAWIVFLFGSAWYAVAHWDVILKQVAAEAAKQAAAYTQTSSNDALKQLQQFLK